MRRRHALLFASALALAAAAPASAADIEVKGLDSQVFDKPEVSIAAGDTVHWTFAGTSDAHNVQATSANWTYRIPPSAPPSTAGQFTFGTPGTYTYRCEFHGSTMVGKVTVGDAPPPPPPPLSEQPFRNEQTAPTVLEITDDTRPALSRVRASRIANGARVRFRVSEPARVRVRVKRGSRTVKSKTVRLARAGSRSVNLRGLGPGSYRIDVLALDLADNRSRIKRARVTVGR